MSQIIWRKPNLRNPQKISVMPLTVRSRNLFNPLNLW